MENSKSNFPEISIIVPVYNVEKYLPKCIDSLLAQTLTDIEIILVDVMDEMIDHAVLIHHWEVQQQLGVIIGFLKKGG